MIKKTVEQEDELRFRLSGFSNNYEVKEAIGFLCDKVLGIKGGVPTGTGIFRNARGGETTGGGCAVEEVTPLRAGYGNKWYNLMVVSDFSSVTLKIENIDPQDVPKRLYERVDLAFDRYVKKYKGKEQQPIVFCPSPT